MLGQTMMTAAVVAVDVAAAAAKDPPAPLAVAGIAVAGANARPVAAVKDRPSL